ncbi:MerR family transcriptional regulator [Paenibacillus guangzhouensis]|uniref:MerR family transcriptional regulator n=1 Tax=Paenibacillus guangzhouensis TaxID=1473112 RepID=UPI0012668EED|nr:MerR family transcriptional regulator [Paenibacillus guangzhouensis]
MKSDITISELAKLMNVSVHQIRYFEEKGVLQPSYTDHNLYRMYDMEQVYQLAHILMLRKLGVSVQSIQECMASFSADHYQQLLHASLRDIDSEMKRLKELKQFIHKVLQEQKNLGAQSNPYQIKRRDTSYLKQWMEMDVKAKLTAKRLAEQTERIPNLFELDVHSIYDGSNLVHLCVETDATRSDFSLPEGNYLSMQCLIHEDDELEQIISQFYDHAAAESYVTTGPLILIEKSYLSLFSNNKLHYELQVLIESDADTEGVNVHGGGTDND